MACKTISPKLFFVNVPAGSGKTHFIKNKVNEILFENHQARILCITYTERAANELKSRIISNDVQISTIHSFINFFISPYFKHREIIELYYEIYKSKVEEKILKNATNILEANQNKNVKYCIDNGLSPETNLSVNIIKNNVNSLYYNEHNYNTLFYGGLSHDNLLGFAFEFLKKYPILKFRLKEMFQHIFVDEVQDTDANILNLFFEAMSDTNGGLYFFGDKMQEIYENYDGSFETNFLKFNNTLSDLFKYNYRSSQEIVTLLNGLYGRIGDDKQDSYQGSNGIPPKLVICKSLEEYYSSNQKLSKEFLLLRLSNRARFKRESDSDTMENIFNAISDVYPNGSKVKPVEAILALKSECSPDILMDFFYDLAKIKASCNNGDFATITQLFNNKKFVDFEGKKQNIFHSNMILSAHNDKKRIYDLLKKIISKYTADKSLSLKDFLEYLVETEIVNKEFLVFITHFENDDNEKIYTRLLQCDLQEMKRVIKYKDNQNISTQHGVKGEGHNKVCFWSEDSKSRMPYVYMYDFFDLYTNLEKFSLNTFQSFYYDFNNEIYKLENRIGKKISALRSDDVTLENIVLFDEILEKFNDNIYMSYIFKNDITEYFSKRNSGKLPTLKSIKSIFKASTVSRILVAYKLFYVGCSRAKECLIVLVEQEKIAKYEEKFKNKMQSIGFVVE